MNNALGSSGPELFLHLITLGSISYLFGGLFHASILYLYLKNNWIGMGISLVSGRILAMSLTLPLYLFYFFKAPMMQFDFIFVPAIQAEMLVSLITLVYFFVANRLKKN